MECKPGQGPASCLTPAQVHAAYEIYKGAHDAEGGKLVISGPLPGSKLGWAGVSVPFPDQKQAFSTIISTGTLQNLAYESNPPAGYTLVNLKFDHATFNAIAQLHGLYDASDPDLGPFAAAGGKLILWHGLADPHISPLNTIAYYTAMQKLMGADAVIASLGSICFPAVPTVTMAKVPLISTFLRRSWPGLSAALLRMRSLPRMWREFRVLAERLRRLTAHALYIPIR